MPHTGVLHEANTAVTSTQNTQETVKNSPNRSAQRRLRNNLARGSAAAWGFSASKSDHPRVVNAPLDQ